MNESQELERAQAALLARYAPETTVRRLTWSQGETQVLEFGSGPPLLLVHGGGDHACEWVPIIAPLARNRCVLAVDRPGHGLADPFEYRDIDLKAHAVRFLEEVVDALALDSVDIAANSIGGWWSAMFAIENPARVSRLAIVGAPPGVNRTVPLPLRAFGVPLIAPFIGRRLLANPTRKSSRSFWGMILVEHPELLVDELLDVDVAHTRRNSETMVGLLTSLIGPRGIRDRYILGDDWQRLRTPSLFLYGDRDKFVTSGVRKAWENIDAQNEQLSVVTIPGCGHLPWFDDPDSVVAELERFLDSG